MSQSLPATDAISPVALAPPRRGAGFTLVELLVVIAVVGVLAALVLPSVQSGREAARRATCSSHLRQIGIALQMYHDANGTFPPGCVERNRLRLAWSVYLLPMIEQQEVWDRFDTSSAYNSPANRAAGGTIVPIYLCPSTARLGPGREGNTAGDRNGNGLYDPGDWLAMADYGGMYGAERASPRANGVMIFDHGIAMRRITDGLSHTIIVAEDSGRGWVWDGEWANGENIFDVSLGINQMQHNELWSDHVDGCFALFCDGSVRFLSNETDQQTLDALCTRAGGEIVHYTQ